MLHIEPHPRVNLAAAQPFLKQRNGPPRGEEERIQNFLVGSHLSVPPVCEDDQSSTPEGSPGGQRWPPSSQTQITPGPGYKSQQQQVCAAEEALLQFKK